MSSIANVHVRLKKLVLILLATALLLLTETIPNVALTQVPYSYDLEMEAVFQYKDSAILDLDGSPLYGKHAWDREHQVNSVNDVLSCDICKRHCAFASIAMINHYYNGNLRQDPIAYHRNTSPDLMGPFLTHPEEDLWHYGLGGSSESSKTLSWALNSANVLSYDARPTLDQMKQWISENRPILTNLPGHSVVTKGYDGSYLHIIDPGYASESRIHYDYLDIQTVHVPPANATGRLEEPTMSLDSDSDGVIDFDETNRFFTDPYNSDSDFDGVPDKAEIISYTFLNDGSFDSEDVRKPDPDSDGLRAELDWDSDNGGAPDGMEDLNRNGFVDIGETDPFNAADDPPVEYPIANFTWFPEVAWINETVTFNASQCYSPNGDITRYAWNFEDETLITTQEPVINYTYSKEGRYHVTLKVIDEAYLRSSISNIINVTYRTDLNKDLEVNIMDVALVAKAYGTKPRDPNWNQIADLNNDEVINILDISTIAMDFGKTV